MKITEIKTEWKNLPHKYKKLFWSNLYTRTMATRRLNEDTYPTLDEWTLWLYGRARTRDIKRDVAFEGILKIKSL